MGPVRCPFWTSLRSVSLRPFWDPLGPFGSVLEALLGPVRDLFGTLLRFISLKPFWDLLGTFLDPFWDSFWGPFEIRFVEILLGPFLGTLLGLF